MAKYENIIIKFSGELFGSNTQSIHFPSYIKIAKELVSIKKTNKVKLSIVIGAGNIFRGRSTEGMNVDRAVADYMGMLGTVINGLALQESMEKEGIQTRMLTAVRMESLAEPYIRRRALRHLDKGRVVIFAGGVGSPFFTTDSAAALRACEIGCDLIIKATNVDGAYDKDPKVHKNAKRYSKLSYKGALEKGINVMDGTAFALCQKYNIPILIMSANKIHLLGKALNKGLLKLGTLVS